MADNEVSYTDRIFSELPEIRILVLGKSGAGKTSLIKEAFKVEGIEGTHDERGKSDINKELRSPENPRFVVHDSEGFEAGETKNLKIVKEFIKERNERTDIKDKLHAIWLCIRTPRTGERAFETGDEEFLKFVKQDFQDIPIVVVFTQYDKLVGQMKYKMAGERDSNTQDVDTKANTIFNEACVDKLRSIGSNCDQIPWEKVSVNPGYQGTCRSLIELTSKLIDGRLHENVWLLSAIAQRVDADLKVNASVRFGIKNYWRNLASSNHFDGKPLARWLEAIRKDVVEVWNFADDEKILCGNEFRGMVFRSIQDLGKSDASSSDTLAFTQDLPTIVAELNAEGSTNLSPLARPPPAFLDWLFGTYQVKELPPATLRTLMGFIVDLTLVLERLFWTVHNRKFSTVSIDAVHKAFNDYSASTSDKPKSKSAEVHEAIREYVKGLTPNGPDRAYKEVKRLIEVHRFVPVVQKEYKEPRFRNGKCTIQ
ncbi:hypothetical protein BOTBODRAFT_145529 [Botryobasidium botryosum FD-172 SS1]|uniref:G domain-containing protein n=1 Tax=Botryobasidium botryosum (strain FD-172 SS1) TaxID=930990 RepID=A0A067MSZ0_BOTB1|nr:hypothetical protein BOTBODRAFT_145529 [Botryobasidium botryosum FD-172 SS1]